MDIGTYYCSYYCYYHYYVQLPLLLLKQPLSIITATTIIYHCHFYYVSLHTYIYIYIYIERERHASIQTCHKDTGSGPLLTQNPMKSDSGGPGDYYYTYTTLRFTTLHYTTLLYTTLHYTTLHYTILHHTILILYYIL